MNACLFNLEARAQYIAECKHKSIVFDVGCNVNKLSLPLVLYIHVFKKNGFSMFGAFCLHKNGVLGHKYYDFFSFKPSKVNIFKSFCDCISL